MITIQSARVSPISPVAPHSSLCEQLIVLVWRLRCQGQRRDKHLFLSDPAPWEEQSTGLENAPNAGRGRGRLRSSTAKPVGDDLWPPGSSAARARTRTYNAFRSPSPSGVSCTQAMNRARSSTTPAVNMGPALRQGFGPSGRLVDRAHDNERSHDHHQPLLRLCQPRSTSHDSQRRRFNRRTPANPARPTQAAYDRQAPL
jgi:hypothetical protein